MKAIILAAGRGSRMGHYTRDIPKCLLPFAGRTLLDWQLAALRSAGVSDVCIVKGFAANTFPSYLRSYYNDEYSSSNMVASLFCASAEMTTSCIVCYSDILYEPRILHSLLSRDTCDVQVAYDAGWAAYYQRRFGDPYAEAESLVVGSDGRISDIGRDEPRTVDVQGRFIGLIRLSAEGARDALRRFSLWREMYWERPWMRGRTLQNAYMTDFLQALIDDGMPVSGSRVEHGWLEFDSLTDYEQAQQWHGDGTLDPLFTFDWIK
jgi:L-glutamine-phosphate cytidylyltransferase